MSHYQYSPIGYSYNAADYCPDCIVKVIDSGRRHIITSFGGYGIHRGKCNCTEYHLDRIATARGINRKDERSFDSGDFPKAIPYHNDLHAECGPEFYGYGPDDPEWERQYCSAVCSRCHGVIGGMSHLDKPDTCPAYEQRMEASCETS